MSSALIDISPMISPEIAVFPGDTAYQNNYLFNFDRGNKFALSQITTTVHLGAHADAPFHYHPEGKTIEQVDLNVYIGACQVIEVNIEKGRRIGVDDFNWDKITEKRVLFKTKSFQAHRWSDDFNSLSPEVVTQLARRKVLLVGIDTPSVDLADDKELITHRCIYEHHIAVLEGLVLGEVEEGRYHLVALPLKLKGCEASPVRAVLFKQFPDTTC